MDLFLYAFALLIFSPLVFWIITFVYTSFRGSPYVPIKKHRLESITSFIKKGDRVADLGCGDGRILIEAINRGAKGAEGWELDFMVWCQAKVKVARSEVDTAKIKVHFGDYWNADLSRFNVIYVYQMTKYLGPFKEKILPQLKKGTLIISPDYEIPDMKLDKKIEDGDRGLYLYKA